MACYAIIAVECPNACAGAGRCLSLKELSATYAVGSEPLYDSVWDAEMIYGCKCRKGYHAYDCSLRTFKLYSCDV